MSEECGPGGERGTLLGDRLHKLEERLLRCQPKIQACGMRSRTHLNDALLQGSEAALGILVGLMEFGGCGSRGKKNIY